MFAAVLSPVLALTDETQCVLTCRQLGITRLVMLALSFVESDPCRRGYWDFEVRSLGNINQDGLFRLSDPEGPYGRNSRPCAPVHAALSLTPRFAVMSRS
jgi:hypothetical protein